MKPFNRLASAVVTSSMLWGGLASLGFFALIHAGTLNGEFFHRYFAGHWINYTETVMFFIALAQLILRSGNLTDQKFGLKKPPFADTVPLGEAKVESGHLLEQLEQLPHGQKDYYLPRRLREVLEATVRKETADELQDDLRHLSDVDAGRAHSGYAMVRLIIWAIPILGFLGTVIGITMAIAALDPKALEKSMDTVTQGLGVAFDTTALALALSMVLMFVQYFVDGQEQRLLAKVDDRAAELLTPRFPLAGSTDDPQMQAVRRMAEAVITSVERTVGRQAELWGEVMTVADERWQQVASLGREQLEETFSAAINRSMELHRQHLLSAEEAAAERTHLRWHGVQTALEACVTGHKSLQTDVARHTESMLEGFATGQKMLHSDAVRQTEALARIIDATGHVQTLEQSLNRNLSSLAASQHLQETLLNLSAAVNLLNARLERITPSSPYLAPQTVVSKAA